MKEKPILFNTEMVKAILENRKHVTRRIIKPQPLAPLSRIENSNLWTYTCCDREWKPKYQKGDHLWVRETWRPCGWGESFDYIWLEYKAGGDKCIDFDENISWEYDGYLENLHIDLSNECTNAKCPIDENGNFIFENGNPIKWKSSIYMPKIFSRIWLEVTDVRVERVQDITNGDIRAEGVARFGCTSHKLNFQDLWDSINKKRGYGWDLNPWVWVYEFKRIKK